MNCRMRAFILVALAFSSTVLLSSTLFAGSFVLSGDKTPAFSLGTWSPGPAIAGNQQFFTNVLGAGADVAIFPTTLNNFDEGILSRFYNDLPGVSSSLIIGSIEAKNLAGVDLLLLPSPDRSFSTSEIAAIGAFLGDDGVVFAMGDSATSTNSREGNPRINDLLVALGSSMRINTDNLDPGAQFAVGDEILDHPLTTSVSSFRYGATASITGGTPLFLAANDAPFVAMEALPVPEPTGFTLVVSAGLFVLIRNS